MRRRVTIRRLLGVLFLGSLTLCLWLGQFTAASTPIDVGQAANAQSSNSHQLVQQGVDAYLAGDYRSAIASWQTALENYQDEGDRANAAVVLENLARTTQQIGQSDQSIAYWQQVITMQQQAGELQQVGRLLTEQAQVYSSLGQHWQAIALLCNAPTAESCPQSTAVAIARTYGDRAGEAAALGSLGEAYRLRGDYDQAIAVLQMSVEIARAIEHPLYLSSALSSLGSAHANRAQVSYRRALSADLVGDTLQANQFREEGLNFESEALTYFQESLTLAQTHDYQAGELRTLVNAIPSYYRAGDRATAASTVQQALSLVEKLPDSQDKVYAAITLSHLLQPVAVDAVISKAQCPNSTVTPQVIDMLQQAIAIAQRIADRRAESFALGELGHVYECRSEYGRAMTLTQEARLAAEGANDSRYLWEWQTGRILKAEGEVNEAIVAYEQAIDTLETIRSDILTANRDIQFDFRDIIEPVYRQLVELRLSQERPSVTVETETSKQNLDAVLDTVNSLRLAELQNYFGNDCILTVVNPERVDFVAANNNTAVFSSIILDDYVAVIVSFPDGRQQLELVNVDSETLRAEINQYRRELERYFYEYTPQQAQKVYDWLIRPFAPALEQAQITTLVFIQDGILRSVPMAALHDGERFLVERYAIATTPSLTLTDPNTPKREELRALALGLAEQAIVEGRPFPALENVYTEIRAVATELLGSTLLLNQEFTRDRLQQELAEEPYPILHIATHGEFGTEPEDTFLVTGDQQKLTITDLDAILRSTNRAGEIELLALTACQTATGDDRAALGLAGVAAQAGVSSVLASLWFIEDETTAEMVTQFYDGLLNSNLSKAEALADAQRSLIQAQERPSAWAPFILIGNWM
jgi:CHAT domain-containing protein